MTDIDLDAGTVGHPTVAHAYYSPDGASASEVLIICLDCDDGNQAPHDYGKATIKDKPVYGGSVPHLHCDSCGTQVTS